MVLQQTPAPDMGTAAPNFGLKGIDGKTYTFDDIKGEKGTLVMFICNHCPYVKAIAEYLVADMKELQENGIGVIAIMPNETHNYPADSFENMKIFAAENEFTFPYVIDETQDTAKAYDAVCTPDFFGYNADAKLQYRGRLNEVNPSHPPQPNTQRELFDAMMQIAQTGTFDGVQKPSMGCSIKWKDSSAA